MRSHGSSRLSLLSLLALALAFALTADAGRCGKPAAMTTAASTAGAPASSIFVAPAASSTFAVVSSLLVGNTASPLSALTAQATSTAAASAGVEPPTTTGSTDPALPTTTTSSIVLTAVASGTSSTLLASGTSSTLLASGTSSTGLASGTSSTVLSVPTSATGSMTASAGTLSASTRSTASSSTVPATKSSVAPAPAPTPASGSCFPMGGATVPASGSITASREQWWCPVEQQYGFLGFSYPMEDSNCNAASNGYAAISRDMAAMKKNYGATMLRVYAPECRDRTVWVNLLRAARDNNMAIIPMVWWGFGSDQTLWKRSQAALIAALTSSEWRGLAPYLVHSVAFGSEPIGDSVDGGRFLQDYESFGAQMAALGIPVAISEDWDRTALATYSGSGASRAPAGLTAYGKQLAAASDLLQLHVMPYYHIDRFADTAAFWPYFEAMIEFAHRTFSGQVLITETMWASQKGGGHSRGGANTGVDMANFRRYYATLTSKCAYFKAQKVGWFFHTYSDAFEPYFGLLDASGKPKMDFAAPRC